MTTTQSDFILNFLNDAEKVEVEIATHIDTVAPRLSEWTAPLLGGGETPDFRTPLLGLKAGLRDSREQLNLAEQLNIDLVRRVVELRGERQTLRVGLYQDFSSIRRTIEELYRGKGQSNPNAFVVAGIQGPTLQRPKRLLRQIDLAVTYMSQPGLVFPPSLLGNNQLNPQDIINVLQPRAQRLREVLAELQQLGSELNASRKEKKRALDLHKRNYSLVSKAASALFQLAGEPELAERIRPTRRKKRRDAESESDPAPSSEDQQGAEAGAEEAESGTGDAGSERSTESDLRSPEPASTDPASGDVTGTQAADSSNA